ncbi:MAG: HAD-IC family P-type ATPase, partial [Candidatus Sungbacteria bacterium]|nr:HAD-IC family P-type ATPase [Candidatus Sungbacteria bacterium]
TVNEAGLTGESEPAAKIETPLKDPSLAPADRKNMVFKGTHVAGGNARAIVIATGSATEIGRIAEEIALIDTDIPLKKDIRYLSRLIIIAVGVISVLLFIPGVLLGRSPQEMFATAVALAVSVIPEGLPIVITLVLATGVWRMSKRNALVKRLQAVEALGQTKIIAVDKTGTLTRNEMTIERVYTNWRMYMITGNGYEPKGDVLLDSTLIDPLEHEDVLFSAKIAAFCARARLSFVDAAHEWKVAGDPTEAALLVFSEKIGLRHEILTEESPEIFELPFDYRRKYHAVARAVDGTHFLTVVGAPESVLALCKNIRQHGRTDTLTDDEHKRLQTAFSNMAAEGFRVVAYAMHTDAGDGIDPNAMPPLTFVGFFGMRDPLRPEVQETVRRIKAADMRIVMITGGHRLTAHAIAREAGIWQEGDRVLTGEDISRLSDAELAEELARASVFARVTPDHKLRIIQAYRARGEVVAMTGDGVNDAPSLVDDFSSILSAVEEGRNIFRTIQKVILYLFSTSAGEVLTIAGAIALGFALPLLPSQIIWLNFVTDGFLDVALAMEPKEKSLLTGAFRRPKKWFVDGLMARRIIFMALPMAAVTLYIFSGYISPDMTKAWTISLTLLAVFQWFNAWNCRSEDRSVFRINPLTNKFLIAATATVIVLQIFAVYHPIMNRLLHTTPLGLAEWLLIIPLAASVIVVEEIRKFFHRRSLAVQAI